MRARKRVCGGGGCVCNAGRVVRYLPYTAPSPSDGRYRDLASDQRGPAYNDDDDDDDRERVME